VRPLDHNASEFLRAIARPDTTLRVTTVTELARTIGSWDDVLRGANEHGILPMLYSCLVKIPDSIPPDVLDRSRREFERNAFHCITNAEELLQVLSTFKQFGIDAMPFKGVVLGASAYGDMTLRRAGDLDLLIHYRDLPRATALLKQRGYELKTRTHADGSPEDENYFEFHFERPPDGMVLELRWRLELTQIRYRRDLGLDWVWHRRRLLTLAGAEVPSLDPVSSLLILCMHGSKHAWSRWMWICDVAMLLEREPALDWNFVRGEAKRVGLERCLVLGVLLAHGGAGANIPEVVLDAFKDDHDMCSLSDFLIGNILTNPGSMPQGRMPYNIRILSFSDKLLSLSSLSILKPNDRDRDLIRLPNAPPRTTPIAS